MFSHVIQYKIECEIQNEVIRLKNKQKIREELNKNKHFHNFGRNQKCECGLFQREYAFQRSDEREVCYLYEN